MITGKPVSDDELGDLLGTFGRSAFRLEAQPFYAIGEERRDFERFLAGSPQPPPELGWWKSYLDRVAAQVRQGKSVGRVRVLEVPPTGYQRWLIWAGPWYAAAGEDIRYLPRPVAERIILPLDHDWWLLDGRQVVVMRFTGAGEVSRRELVTDPAAVARYRLWQETAATAAAPAPRITAA